MTIDNNICYVEPSEEYYKLRMEELDKLLSDFCEIVKISKEKDVQVNVKALKQVIRRVNMRKYYFKIFHNNMEINEYKLNAGLVVFWLIKLHPFWVLVDSDDDNLLELAEQFNEKFAVHIVLSLLKKFNVGFIEKGKDLLMAYTDELTYSFRYRDLSKESLFLMFDPFYYLYFYNNSTTEEGEPIL